jgi:glycosyltransferase involved in cell wall biosynthesis
VEAFNALRRPLIVVGDGPAARRLRRLAGPTVRFTGRVSDLEVAELLSTSRALVVTAAEEFGIAAVEAQAAGRPVIAPNVGGVLESIVNGRTGTFYRYGDPSALARAVEGFDALAVDPAACVASARRFDKPRFQRELGRIVDAAVAGERVSRPGHRPPVSGLVLQARRSSRTRVPNAAAGV